VNAELQRNLWLELRPMPCATSLGILGLLAFAGAAEAGVTSANGLGWLQKLGLVVFCFYAVWGLHKASTSVTDEVQGGTWDQQRLSGQDGAALLVGKLLGATAFTWFGALGGLTLYVVAQLALGGPLLTALHTATLLLGALAVQAAGLGGSLVVASRQRGARRKGRGVLSTAGWLLAGWFGLMPLLWSLHRLGLGRADWKNVLVPWWLPLPIEAFAPLSLGLALAWLLIGVHRLLRLELQLPVTPWTWLAFLMFVPTYTLPIIASGSGGLVGWPSLLAGVCLGATWLMILVERTDAVRLRTLVGIWQRGDRQAWWGTLPLWPLSLALALASTAMLLVDAALGTTPLPLAEPGLGAFGLACLALLMVRDAALVLTAQLITPAHREPLGPVLVGGVILYGLLPAVLMAWEGKANLLLPAFWPLLAFSGPELASPKGWALHLTLPLLGALLATGLAAYVLRRTLDARVRTSRNPLPGESTRSVDATH
jgi:hypothetical protein